MKWISSSVQTSLKTKSRAAVWKWGLPQLCILTIVFPEHALAKAIEPEGVRSIRMFTLDNDSFSGTDEFYSSGVRLTRVFAHETPGFFPQKVSQFAKNLLPRTDGIVNGGYYIGHSIFTPNDPEKVDLGPFDRPYAGWIGGGAWIREKTENTSRSIGLSLGWVGPSALGKELQDIVHDITNDPKYSWSEQLSDEPTVNLHYRERHRVGEVNMGLENPGIIDVEVGADLGNLQIGLVGRSLIRFGKSGPLYYFPTERFGPGPEIPMDFTKQPQGLDWSGYFGFEGLLLARTLFLDGNTWRDSRSVNSETFIGSAVGGFTVRWRQWGFGYSHVFRTRENEGQPDTHSWGQLIVVRRF